MIVWLKRKEVEFYLSHPCPIKHFLYCSPRSILVRRKYVEKTQKRTDTHALKKDLSTQCLVHEWITVSVLWFQFCLSTQVTTPLSSVFQNSPKEGRETTLKVKDAGKQTWNLQGNGWRDNTTKTRENGPMNAYPETTQDSRKGRQRASQLDRKTYWWVERH